ncbi:hypothetical protein [Amycolatopsis magusensis]|uniref:Uncharacterized protein n=1 Tax=Amycolatopsis magusensis TaxID=882444 RepID=A0ABS4PS35_9PSEU|nr:hypothetical protein [Amycolatopsis magusensis]MBP2182113.1 hypothetical protein [Amycolatopsis magusensis]MDI5977174.1 hypothetical protein [Amycolatopsis magusensis]UJW31694.1 hypothetical protein L3Q67_42100 [Saccharothrix sp. AJ9571]
MTFPAHQGTLRLDAALFPLNTPGAFPRRNRTHARLSGLPAKVAWPTQTDLDWFEHTDFRKRILDRLWQL